MGVPLPSLRHPVVAAPMAAGPSTPALVAAVSAAGGLGLLAAGYKKTSAVAAEIAAVRAATTAPFGVNVFLPGPEPDPAAVAAYARRLATGGGPARGGARRAGGRGRRVGGQGRAAGGRAGAGGLLRLRPAAGGGGRALHEPAPRCWSR